MHDSTVRLYAAAKEMRGVEGQSRVASLLGAEFQQTVNNWETRGVSKDGALLAQKAIGCDALWLLSGEGSPVAGWPFAQEYLGRLLALPERERGIVEGRLIAAIEECERPNNLAVTVDEGISLVNQARLPPRASKRLGRKSA